MNSFKNLNAMPKLMIGSGLLLLVTGVIGYQGIRVSSELSDRIGVLYNRDVTGLEAIKQVEVDMAFIGRCSRNAVIDAGNAPLVEAANKDFQVLIAHAKASLDLAYSKAVRETYRTQIRTAEDLLPVYEQKTKSVFQFAMAGDAANAKAALKDAGNIDRLNEAVQNAVLAKKETIQIFKNESRQSFLTARSHLIWSVILAAVLGLCVAFVIARQFSTPLKAAAEMLQHVAKGDLARTLDINTTNEIGNLAKALNLAIGSMRDVLTQVGESSSNLASASVQLAKAADNLATGSQEQAASLEQTSASLEEITATVRQNSANALQASQFAVSSRDSAEKGGEVVSSAMIAMSEINASSSKIAAIIGAIDEIAFQTNLLAVNASVEAARAGEHGRGFAVVATEVRNLAQRSAGAAKEIKTLIGDSVRKVENGSALVTHSGQTLSEIVAAVKRVTDIVGEIAAASREQSSGIEQVNGAMMQMDRVMQSNSSQTEELSATANALASQAAHLEKLVGRFVVTKEPQASKAATLVKADRISAGPSTGASSLPGLAKNVGSSVTSTLDEEFEEF